jgi:hypothetical protein
VTPRSLPAINQQQNQTTSTETNRSFVHLRKEVMMDERENRQEREPGAAYSEHQRQSEKLQKDVPRIYVASLSDYNNGVLHGRWIDASSDPEDMQT